MFYFIYIYLSFKIIITPFVLLWLGDNSVPLGSEHAATLSLLQEKQRPVTELSRAEFLPSFPCKCILAL